jgi:serine phosphatase RsbU (regulator of sigma subunit)
MILRRSGNSTLNKTIRKTCFLFVSFIATLNYSQSPLRLNIFLGDSKSNNPIQNGTADIYIQDSILFHTAKSDVSGEIKLELDISKNYRYKIKLSFPNYIQRIFEINTQDVPKNTYTVNPLSLGYILFLSDSLADNTILDFPASIYKYNPKNKSFEQDAEYAKYSKIIGGSMKNLWNIKKRSDDQKEQQYRLNLKESENKRQQEEISKQKFIRNTFIVGLIMTFASALFIFKSLHNNIKQKKILFEKHSEIQLQKHIIEEKQKEIIDSITYAKRLQHAILPPQNFIDQHVPNNFVLYKPKDIVAGDFYWAEKVGDKFFIASADSTGHGVPGAMVSVVCSNALNRTVKEFNLTDTGKILDKARELVLETFEKSSSDVKDGMDISLLCIDRSNKIISWSGANNPLWYIQDNELKEIKADKQPIGKTENPKPFTTQHIEYVENTAFYLFTDGLPDQFGGPNGKKFKYKQFEQLLISIHHLSPTEQSGRIEKAFEDWKGELEQVDDVCVIGIRVSGHENI